MYYMYIITTSLHFCMWKGRNEDLFYLAEGIFYYFFSNCLEKIIINIRACYESRDEINLFPISYRMCIPRDA